MAKKKSKKKGSSSRRVGAAKLNPKLLAVAGVAAGYLVGDKVNAKIASVAGSVDPKIIAGAEAVVGGFLLFKKGKKSPVQSVVGGFLLGAGVKTGLKAFGVINGFQNIPVIGKRMAGFQNVPVIGAYATNPVAVGAFAANRSPIGAVMGCTDGSGSGLMRAAS